MRLTSIAATGERGYQRQTVFSERIVAGIGRYPPYVNGWKRIAESIKTLRNRNNYGASRGNDGRKLIVSD